MKAKPIQEYVKNRCPRWISDFGYWILSRPIVLCARFDRRFPVPKAMHICPKIVGAKNIFGNEYDLWETGRWSVWQKLRDWWLNWTSRHYGGTYWSRSWGKPPRSCNYCGGIHPEDMIEMMTRGWRIESTKGGSKFYLWPPGCRPWEMVCGSPSAPPWVPGPIPPIKGYSCHFSEDKISLINRLNKQA